MADTGLLVILDSSPASKRAVKYVGTFVGRRKGFRICLLHVLPPMPSRLLEHGGSEDPGKEVRLEVDLKDEQHLWLSSAKKASEKGLDEARSFFRTAGVSAATVKALSYEPGENQDAADIILNTARRYRCHTIVVGRRSVSWFHKLFSEQLSDELVRRGKKFCVWAID